MMEAALRQAGFFGVEQVGAVIYARGDAALPEFTATQTATGWLLAQSWPLRASPAQIAEWNALHPEAPMDICSGETRITWTAQPEALPHWAKLIRAMTTQCVSWRRASRQRDEGM